MDDDKKTTTSPVGSGKSSRPRRGSGSGRRRPKVEIARVPMKRPQRTKRKPGRFAQSPEINPTPKMKKLGFRGTSEQGSREKRKKRAARKPAGGEKKRGRSYGSNDSRSTGSPNNSVQVKMPAPKLYQASQKSIEITCKIPMMNGIPKFERVLIEMQINLPRQPHRRLEWREVANLPANEAQRVQINGLKENTSYYFRCKGLLGNEKWSAFSTKSAAMVTKQPMRHRKRPGQSDDSHPVKKTRVGLSKPGQPRPPICVRRTSTTITIAWSAPKDTGRAQIDSFQVQKRTFPENKDDPKVPSWTDLFSRQGFDGKMYEVTGLKPNSVLQFRVKGKNIQGWGKYSGASDPFTTLKQTSEFKVPSAPDDKYSIVLNVDDIRYDDPKVRLGRGSFGVVYRSAVGGYRGTTVAVKVETQVYDDPEADADEQLKDWLREVKILACLRHPNLVLYMGACRASGRRYIVTEYMGGRSLACALHTSAVPLTEKWRITSILLQVASAMAYLHSNTPEITHRDLKPANVLLDKTWTHAKVCDFGLARMHTQSNMSTLTKFAGTAPYMPPEALDEDDVSGKVDVYSFAILICETLLREVPWKGMSSSSIVKNVCIQNKRPYELARLDDKPLEEMVAKCWNKDPDARPSFDGILPMMNKMGWQS